MDGQSNYYSTQPTAAPMDPAVETNVEESATDAPLAAVAEAAVRILTEGPAKSLLEHAFPPPPTERLSQRLLNQFNAKKAQFDMECQGRLLQIHDTLYGDPTEANLSARLQAVEGLLQNTRAAWRADRMFVEGLLQEYETVAAVSVPRLEAEVVELERRHEEVSRALQAATSDTVRENELRKRDARIQQLTTENAALIAALGPNGPVPQLLALSTQNTSLEEERLRLQQQLADLSTNHAEAISQCRREKEEAVEQGIAAASKTEVDMQFIRQELAMVRSQLEGSLAQTRRVAEEKEQLARDLTAANDRLAKVSAEASTTPSPSARQRGEKSTRQQAFPGTAASGGGDWCYEAIKAPNRSDMARFWVEGRATIDELEDELALAQTELQQLRGQVGQQRDDEALRATNAVAWAAVASELEREKQSNATLKLMLAESDANAGILKAAVVQMSTGVPAEEILRLAKEAAAQRSDDEARRGTITHVDVENRAAEAQRLRCEVSELEAKRQALNTTIRTLEEHLNAAESSGLLMVAAAGKTAAFSAAGSAPVTTPPVASSGFASLFAAPSKNVAMTPLKLLSSIRPDAARFAALTEERDQLAKTVERLQASNDQHVAAYAALLADVQESRKRTTEATEANKQQLSAAHQQVTSLTAKLGQWSAAHATWTEQQQRLFGLCRSVIGGCQWMADSFLRYLASYAALSRRSSVLQEQLLDHQNGAGDDVIALHQQITLETQTLLKALTASLQREITRRERFDQTVVAGVTCSLSSELDAALSKVEAATNTSQLSTKEKDLAIARASALEQTHQRIDARVSTLGARLEAPLAVSLEFTDHHMKEALSQAAAWEAAAAAVAKQAAEQKLAMERQLAKEAAEAKAAEAARLAALEAALAEAAAAAAAAAAPPAIAPAEDVPATEPVAPEAAPVEPPLAVPSDDVPPPIDAAPAASLPAQVDIPVAEEEMPATVPPVVAAPVADPPAAPELDVGGGFGGGFSF